jgi:seryl-tRNA synthetase
LSEIDKQAGDISQKLADLATDVSQTYNVAAEGYDVLFEYINEKVKAKGEKIDTHMKDTIKDFFDSNVASFIKGIEEARGTALKRTKEWSQVADKQGKALLTDLERCQSVADDIGKQIDKKRKKLFQSKKYKDKIKNYEAQLDELRKTAKEQTIHLRDVVLGIAPMREAQIQQLKVAATTTVEEIEKRVSFYTRNGLKELEKAKTDMQSGTKQFRDRNFGAEIALLKKWATEADDMEEEAQEK